MDNQRWMGQVDEKLKEIKSSTDCLPELCEKVARHDEQIKGLRYEHNNLVNRVWYLVALLVPIFVTIAGIVYANLKGETP